MTFTSIGAALCSCRKHSFRINIYRLDSLLGDITLRELITDYLLEITRYIHISISTGHRHRYIVKVCGSEWYIDRLDPSSSWASLVQCDRYRLLRYRGSIGLPLTTYSSTVRKLVLRLTLSSRSLLMSDFFFWRATILIIDIDLAVIARLSQCVSPHSNFSSFLLVHQLSVSATEVKRFLSSFFS